MGNLRLQACQREDAFEILQGQAAAFRNPRELFFFLLFPEHESSERAVNRMLEWWLSDKDARYMKIVDEETGAIVSAAKWCIHKEGLTEQQMKAVPHVDWQIDEDTNRWVEHLFYWISRHRLERTKDTPHCVLDMLSTHPDHQKRGAGSMLMKYGTEIADSLGLDCYIEGTALAKRLYESHGFVAEETVVPVPDRWKDRPEIRYFFYVRTRRPI